MQFLERVLKKLEEQRQKSIGNIDKNDLYTREDICEILKWYDGLILIVKNNPPSNQVIKIIIREDAFGVVNSITYVYGKNDSFEIEIDHCKDL